MNLVYSNDPPSPYLVSGQELRIRWNIAQHTREGLDGEPETYWLAEEAVCPRFAERGAWVEAIIATRYTTGAELAAINNQADKPETYAEYQAFRTLAKQLAAGFSEMSA
jgi:hypothetical protein